MNNLRINVNFPFINKKRKTHLSLIKNRNKRPNYFIDNENYKIKTLNPFGSLDYFQKNTLVKSFSSNSLYITKLPSEERKNKIKKNKFEEFGSQIIPPISRIKTKKERHTKNIKKKFKELKYVGVLLGLVERKGERDSKIKLGVPLESRKDYYNFIRYKRKLFFNPNATSNYVHETKTNNLISSNTKIRRNSLLNEEKKKKEEQEELLELRDKVPYKSFVSEKMMNKIRGLFTEDFKFNNMELNEEFYQKFENRINFMEDIYKLPVIKNNLVKFKIDNNKSLSLIEWKNINVINHQTLNYLNQLKRKIQREKDEKAKKLEEFLRKKREEEKEYELLEKKNEGKNIEKKDENKNMEEEEKLKTIMAEIINKEEQREQKFEELYSIEEYFMHKNIYFSDNVSIASERLRSIFFNN